MYFNCYRVANKWKSKNSSGRNFSENLVRLLAVQKKVWWLSISWRKSSGSNLVCTVCTPTKLTKWTCPSATSISLLITLYNQILIVVSYITYTIMFHVPNTVHVLNPVAPCRVHLTCSLGWRGPGSIWAPRSSRSRTAGPRRSPCAPSTASSHYE